MEAIALINEAGLDDWMRQNPADAPGLLADLVGNLVAASCPTGDRRFPRSDSIGQPGLDGLLVTPVGVPPNIPEGRSIWEWGSGGDPASKATEDYDKRTTKEPEAERRGTTFVFVTPLSGRRVWPEDKQREWIRKRKEAGDWLDVRVIDGTRLIEWLEQEQAVKLWLAERMGLDPGTASTPSRRWRMCARASEPELPPLCHKVFLVQRDEAIAALQDLLAGVRRYILFESQHADELIPFVCAYLQSLGEGPERNAAQRSIIVHSAQAWTFMTRRHLPHIIIADFELKQPEITRLLMEVKDGGHSWIYTMPPGASTAAGRVVLPTPNVYHIAKALAECGFPSERAHALAKQCGGRLGLLVDILMEVPFTLPPAMGAASAALVTATLLGAWREDYEADLDAGMTLAGNSDWFQLVRDQSMVLGSPLTHHAPEWRMTSRLESWTIMAPRIFDDQLERFEKVTTEVLRERDPQFELPPEERYAAAVHRKVLKHSSPLRKGLAETLAILGARPEMLTSASLRRPQTTARLTVRAILNEADWVLWASLQDVLPELAEAAPAEFLDAVESALATRPSPFDELFGQEGRGIFGRTYMSGLLWALEALAWDPRLLSRVALVLAELDAHDPGGQWSNRPLNSLSTILKPWIPRTTATIEQRVAAVRAVVKEFPEAGWKLLLDLVPKSHDVSGPTHKPTWRVVPGIDSAEEVTREDVARQYSAYSAMAVEMAKASISRLSQLANRLNDLPQAEFNAFIEHFEQGALDTLDDEARYPLWLAVASVTDRHRRFADADWAMSAQERARLEVAAARIEPKNPAVRHRALFDQREYNLLDGEGSFQEQHARLEAQRQAALAEVIARHGEPAIIEFAKRVEMSGAVGWTYGTLASARDDLVFPGLLTTSDSVLLRFAHAFAASRLATKGWQWVDTLDRSAWTPEATASLLHALHFTQTTWERVERFLGAEDSLYWRTCPVHAFAAEEGLPFAAEKLLAHGRPRAAIDCIVALEHHMTEYDRNLAVKVLLAAAITEDKTAQLDTYHIREIIVKLQQDERLSIDDIAKVEFAYLALLDREDKARPIILERQIAGDPAFFMQLIPLVYRSKKETTPRVLDEREKLLAQGAYRLLKSWTLLPGTRSDGSLDAEVLNAWVSAVKTAAEESGHFDVAMMQIGEVFAHAPADPDGFWIHRGVASILNGRDAEAMRDGFRTELFNKRGAFSFTLDTAGNAEEALAAEWRKRADDMEREGFMRVAIPLRELAEGYERDAAHMRSMGFLDG